MRVMLCVLLSFVGLAMVLPNQALAIPNCDQVIPPLLCGYKQDCTSVIEWRGACAGEIPREWRCHWTGPYCEEEFGDWQPCSCWQPGCDCLPAGTPITLADGTTKPVEKIQVGDRVLSYDQLAAGMTSAEVVAVHAPYAAAHYFVVNEKVSMTENHPVLVGGEWVAAGQLKVGDMLTRAGGDQESIFSIRRVDEAVTVFNFQVSLGTYVAGGFIMHNKEDCEDYIQLPRP
jgi:hypothetical protein